MPFIEWRPTSDRNVEILNETADLYRYFDCTEAAEFLYACMQRTVEHDLPREIDYLQRHDEALRQTFCKVSDFSLHLAIQPPILEGFGQMRLESSFLTGLISTTETHYC
jgi:hypothetical protein